VIPARTPLDHGEQAVLGRQRLLHPTVSQADAGDAPPAADPALGEIVEVHGLMRTVEAPHPEVDDRRRHGGAVVRRDRDARRVPA
jgi:hypothetical protein